MDRGEAPGVVMITAYLTIAILWILLSMLFAMFVWPHIAKAIEENNNLSEEE